MKRDIFFDFFGKKRAKQLQGVCCDMWMPYINVIEEKAPKAVLVFDKFHIVRHLMNAVDQVRRDEIREKERNIRNWSSVLVTFGLKTLGTFKIIKRLG